MSESNLRILIIAEHASIKFGGEAALPVHYFRVLRKREVNVWMIVHERSRKELAASFPDDLDRIHFIPDDGKLRLLNQLGKGLPRRLSYFTNEWIMRNLTGRAARRLAKRLIDEHHIDVIHQPIPVSPKEPSLIHGLGVPVVIGPMNGGMNYPPAFRDRQSRAVTQTVQAGRLFADAMNRLIPGKRRAALLLTANQRTTDALPNGISAPVVELVENGVDLTVWDRVNEHVDESTQSDMYTRGSDGQSATRFVFLGRLVDCKAVDLLFEALKRANDDVAISLDIVGDGPIRAELERLATELSVTQWATFHGWKTQAEAGVMLRASAGLILPSLHECGGAVVLEAMACGRPVIAANWGGPADYLDPSCGILVDPTSREAFIAGLTDAMIRLANDPVLGDRMGAAGRAKVEREYDWDAKALQILELYRRAADTKASVGGASPTSTHPTHTLQADAR